ncbi:MAG: ATP-dependent RecD-like DNA helicase [Lentisphaerae bacterium]|nr:ATP-dependent RecD-like DNA helicase [Lentisphaerota bacterium]
MDNPAETLSGTVENVVYHNEATHYTVCAVRLDGQRETITLVGAAPAVWEGETVRAEGRWVQHPRHGRQFQADSLTCVVPTSAAGIERFLAGGMIKGIGKTMAHRLVQAFGEETLRVIDKESKRLEEVEGIGPQRRRMIKESWDAHSGTREVMIFLQSHGIGTAKAARIFRQYGGQAIALVRENPYRLCDDIWGIGFKTADAVAMSVGVPPHSEIRARAGLVYRLQTLADEGHCYCPQPELLLQTATLLDIPVEIVTAALERQVESGALVRDDGRIYKADLHHAEVGVADKLCALLQSPPGYAAIQAEKAVAWAERLIGLRFAPEQARALAMALSSKVSIITGGPGVGKTTIIKALVDVFKRRRLDVLLAAPTGRAAKRMEEATQHEAKTMHRLLKYNPHLQRFEHGPDNPLEGDMIILDEVSMVDIHLMYTFLRAVPDRCSLVLVGDVDQLPSVGPGNVLTDLIDADRVPCTRLETIYRQEAGGWIVQNAHRVNRGEFIEVPAGDELADFYFVEAADPDQVVRMLLNLVTDRIPDRFGFDPLADVQVLTPMRKNRLGADNLNTVLQEALNPSGPAVQRFGRRYREGDRVMQIRNNYDKDVFNGDIGRIRRVDEEDSVIVVDYDGRPVKYELAELDELVHAYACSIHKAQGSEYPAVIVLLTTQHFRLLQRNLLYTALTRGRRLVVLLGSRKAIYIAIHNNEIKLRRTGLRERLAAGPQTQGAGARTYG